MTNFDHPFRTLPFGMLPRVLYITYFGFLSLVICREHIRVSKGAFQSILVIYGSMVIFMSKSDFSLSSSFVVWFERVIYGLGGQNWFERSIKTWSMRVQCKNRKIFTCAWQKQIFCTFLDPKDIILFGIRYTPSCTPPGGHIGEGVSSNHKFSNTIKLSWIV